MLPAIIAFGLLHNARGQESFGSKTFPRALWASLSTWCAMHAGWETLSAFLVGCAVGATYWVASAPALGLYFAAFTGWWRSDVKGVEAITRLGLWLVPFSGEWALPRNRLRGIICMALRSSYFGIMPLSIAIVGGISHGFNLSALILCVGTMLCCLLPGLIYGAMRWLPKYDVNGVRFAEFITGTWLGLIIIAQIVFSGP